MDIMQVANSIPMWIACAIPVSVVVFQSVFFALKAHRAKDKLGISDQQEKAAIKSAAITAIGPSIVILASMLSLLVTVGGPIGWMRLSLIGAVMYESTAAGIGTASVGVTLGVDPMTAQAFTQGVWTMVVGSLVWVLFGTFSADKMSRVQDKVTRGNRDLMITIAGAAVIGVFAAMTANNFIQLMKTASGASLTLNKYSLSAVLGAVLMWASTLLGKKFNLAWMKDWSLTISILGSVVLCALV